MPFSVHPLAGAVITAAKMADHLKYLLSLANRYHSGYDKSNTGLNVTVQTGIAFINGFRCGLAIDADVTKPLTASSTNHVYLQYSAGAADIVVNTTGIAPSNSLKLYELTTNGSAVTATLDVREDTIIIEDDLQANVLTSLAGVYGTLSKLEGTQPYLELNDTAGGGDDFRIWCRNGKIQITDTSGAVIYVDDLSELYQGYNAPVIDKDLTSPPGSPATYDRYIVGAAATGAWATHDNKIAEYTGSAWQFFTPAEGWLVHANDENLYYQYTGSAWTAIFDGVVAPTASTVPKRTTTGGVRAADAVLDSETTPLKQMQQLSFNNSLMLGGM